jgi:hypothetical protein
MYNRKLCERSHQIIVALRWLTRATIAKKQTSPFFERAATTRFSSYRDIYTQHPMRRPCVLSSIPECSSERTNNTIAWSSFVTSREMAITTMSATEKNSLRSSSQSLTGEEMHCL